MCLTLPASLLQALYAIRNLLLLRSTEGLVFKDFCKLDLLLERMRQQLQQLMVDENHREYAMDVESLRQEVQQTFIQKLDKVRTKAYKYKVHVCLNDINPSSQK